MNLANILTRRDPLKKAFVALEDGMTDALNEAFVLPPEDEPSFEENEPREPAEELQAADEPQAAEPAPTEQPPAERFSAHAQQRLAAFAAFSDARMRTQDDLGRISEALAGIFAAHNTGREFLDDCYADIHRANDLEYANASQATEIRRLSERVDKLERLRTRYDQLVEVLKRREAKLLDEAETTREQIGALRLEVVETRNTIARGESVQGELQTALASRNGEAERYMREAEVLREKNVGIAVELDLLQKKHAESRRRVEELSGMHASDSARLAEIMARLVAEESETVRLQKLNDTVEAKLIESNEIGSRLSLDLGERDKRYHSENQALRDEIQALKSRLQTGANDQRETASELAALRSRVNDLDSEKQVMEKKLGALAEELEAERRRQAALPYQAEPDDTQEAGNQTDRMRSQIADLQATVAQLKQYENLYAAAKARPRGKPDAANGFTVAANKSGPEFGPTKQAARN